MTVPRHLLTDDEELLLDLRPHWVLLLPRGAVTFFSLVVLIWLSSFGILPFAVFAMIAVSILASFASKMLTWYFTSFAVTSERLIVRSGVVAKTGIEIPIDRINTVFFSQGVIERVLRAGDLSIESASEQGRQTFDNIRNPANVQSVIYRAREEFDSRARRHSGDAVGAAVLRALEDREVVVANSGNPDDALDELDRAHRLLISGALTQDEFDRLKRRLLGDELPPPVV